MVIKINNKPPSTTPFTSSEWYKYFFTKAKKNTQQICILRECFKNIELNLPFLDESQHWGRTYQLLGIPHICGKVNKAKLREMYMNEKKNKLQSRLSKLNVDVKKTNCKANKDYRAIIRRNRIVNKENVCDDQNKSDLEKKILIKTNELNSEIKSKKKVRFNNVQILPYNNSISSESDSEYIPTFYQTTQKLNTDKTEILQPYFERLNDSQSCESVSDNEDNDNDTGVISPAVSSLEEINVISTVQVEENHNNDCVDEGNTNEENTEDSREVKNTTAATIDPFPRESDEILSDIVENDYDTGVMSPMLGSMEENINETFSENVNNSEDISSIRACDSLSDEEEEILCSPDEATEYSITEIKIARENAKRKPKLLSDCNNSDSINNQRDISTTSDVIPGLSAEINENMSNIAQVRKFYNDSALCSALNELIIERIQETQNTEEINSSISQKTTQLENKKSSDIFNKSSESDELSSDFNEQNLLDTSHLNAEELVFFIPRGNLICPKIDHLEDYRLSSSCSSMGSFGTSLLQKDLGFGNISKNKSICNEQLEAKMSSNINDSSIRDSLRGDIQRELSRIHLDEEENQDMSNIDTSSSETLRNRQNSPESVTDLNKENQRNDPDKNVTNTSEDDSSKIIPNTGSSVYEPIQTKHNSPLVNLDSIEENQINELCNSMTNTSEDDSSKIISNTGSYNSEIKDQNQNESPKRQPLQLLSNNSLQNRFSNKNKVLHRNDALHDKENEIQTLDKKISSGKHQNFLNTNKTITTPSILSQETNERSSIEILPPSDDFAKDAYVLQEKIRGLYKSKVKTNNSPLLIIERKELVERENSNFNYEESLLSRFEEAIARKNDDENMREVQDYVENNKSLLSADTELITKQSVTNKIVTQYIGNKAGSKRGNDDFLPLQRRSSTVNVCRVDKDETNSRKFPVLTLNLNKTEEQNKLPTTPNEAQNQFRKKSSLTNKQTIYSDYDENYADSSSNYSNESIELSKKVKRKRKVRRISTVRMKNISNNDQSPRSMTSSDDVELIEKIQKDNKRTLNEALSLCKKTTTTGKIVISQVSSSTDQQTKDNKSSSSNVNDDYSSLGGGQRITEELEKKKKTSAVKQQINNISSDTSTTSEFITHALARRIFYLNQP